MALDAAPRAQAEPLSLDDIAERVQRILDDPTREADVTDESVLLAALQERRAADLSRRRTGCRAAADEKRIAERRRRRAGRSSRAAPARSQQVEADLGSHQLARAYRRRAGAIQPF